MFKADEAFCHVVDMLKKPKGSRSFLNAHYSDFASWSKETREWIRGLLLYSPRKIDPKPEIAEEVDFGSYTRKHLYFYTAENCRVSAYLLVPKKAEGLHPAVVALHDHSARFYYGKEKLVDHKTPLPVLDEFQVKVYGGRGYASALAERGYVVLVTDALGWGERRWTDQSWLQKDAEKLELLEKGSREYILEYDRLWKINYAKLVTTILYAGSTYMGMLVWDDMRSVDYLCSLPFVDSGRIGCIGLSMGGYRSYWLGAMDERIKASCSAGFTMRFRDTFPHRQTDPWAAVPGMYGDLPYPDLAGLIAPRKLLTLYCENDSLFDLASMELAVDRIRRAFKKAGFETSFQSSGFPAGHQFNLSMQEQAFEWLDDNL